MQRIGGRFDTALVVALLCAVVAMEALYAQTMFGPTPAGWAIMTAVIVLHMIKPRLLLAACDATGWRRVVIGAASALLIALSFVAAVGFLAHLRHDMLAARVGKIETVKALDAQIADLQIRVRQTGATVRDASVIEAEIAALLVRPMQGQAVGSVTRKCDPAHPGTPTAAPCRVVLRLRQELAQAASVTRWKAEIADLERKRDWASKTSGADPQAEVFVALAGASVEVVQTAIIVAFAFGIELVTTVAPYALLRKRTVPAPEPPSPRNRRHRVPGKAGRAPTAAGSPADKAGTSAKSATANPFRSDVRAFVETHLVCANGAAVTGAEIQAAYAAFRAENGLPPRGGNAVMQEVQAALGIRPVKNGRGRSEYRGVKHRTRDG